MSFTFVRPLALLATASLLVAGACSASGDGGASGDAGAAGAPTDGGAGASGSGGGGGGGGSGGVLIVDGGGAAGGGGLDGEACTEVLIPSTPEVVPADIVFAIDTSPSMQEEVGFVRAAMNRFSQQLVDASVDARFVLVAAQDPPPVNNPAAPKGICIDAPLGSGTCPFDTKLPRYQHVLVPVSSTDALYVVRNEYDRYKGMLRPNSLKLYVVVSDGDSAMSADQFTDDLQALDPTKIKPGLWKFYGIFPFRQCSPIATQVGVEYGKLVQQTGGVKGDLCQQADGFTAVFDALARDAIASVHASCTWTIPPPPPGRDLEPGRLNFDMVRAADGLRITVGKVPSREECTPAHGGWYYDDDANPTTIIACPSTCSTVMGATIREIGIRFGCKTVEAPR